MSARRSLLERDEPFGDAIGSGRSQTPDLLLATVAVVSVVAVALALFARFQGESSGSAALDAALFALVVAVATATWAVYRSNRSAVAAQELVAWLRFRDPLTELPNHQYLSDCLGDLVARAETDARRVAVLVLEIDRFKALNESHGRDSCDQLLCAIADRLRPLLGEADSICRIGGPRFVLIAGGISGTDDAERLALQVLGRIEEPFEINQDRMQVTATVGVSLAEHAETDAEAVLADADAAFVQAQTRGNASFAMFDRSMRGRLTPTTARHRLHQALEEGEFRLYYQPIVSLWTKRLVGVEALLRWDDPSRGIVRPDEFLPALEQTGLILPVGRWVLDEVCRQAGSWADRFSDRPPLNITTNLSCRQLAQLDLVDQIEAALGQGGADPALIYLEISEQALSDDNDQLGSTLKRVKDLGCHLALDHFGGELGSISWLRRFDFDLLKLDRSYVSTLGDDRRDTEVVRHVLSLAKSLDIGTLGLGVETEAQIDELRAAGCDLAQGYFYSTPQPPDVIDLLLRQPALQNEWKPVPAGDAAPTVVRPELPAVSLPPGLPR